VIDSETNSISKTTRACTVTENSELLAETTDDRNISPRSTLRAVLLTLLMAGLGHVYCGELVVGLMWAAAGALSGVISLWVLATQDGIVALASLPMWLVTIAAVAHVWSTASKCPKDYRLKQYNRASVYILLLAISSFGVVGHGQLIRSNIVEAYITPVSNMKPTLRAGDRFLVDKTAYRDSPIEVGDVVVFKNPANPRMAFVKRVVAVAGDRVEMREGKLIVNDQPTTGLIAGEGNAVPAGDFTELKVPPYNCFVLGDNRSNSRDSRHFGPIPYATVLGKATVIFWSIDSWSRLGQIE
jgi:signal peptidase I